MASFRCKTEKRLGTSMSIFGMMVVRVWTCDGFRAIFPRCRGLSIYWLAASSSLPCSFVFLLCDCVKNGDIRLLWILLSPVILQWILLSGPSTKLLRRYAINTMKTYLRNSEVCFDFVQALSNESRAFKLTRRESFYPITFFYWKKCFTA